MDVIGLKLPLPRCGHGSFIYEEGSKSFIIVFGGFHGDKDAYLQDMFLFDIGTREWSEIAISGGKSVVLYRL